MPASAPPVEETLAWEAQERPRAGVAALLSGLLTLGGGIGATLVYKDFPSVLLLDGLRDATGTRPPGGGLKTQQVLFVHDHALGLIVTSAILALGAILMAGVLGYLYRATHARRPELPRIAVYAGTIAPVLLGVSELVLQIAIAVKASDFAGGHDMSTQAAHDALQGGVIVAASLLRQLAVFALALAFVLISLNAMRVGLLTRFMGVLGIIVGVLFILPLGQQLPVVQCFWLIAVGALILGRWPNGVPPAWQTGRAQPWPTQQELREAREAAAAARRGDPAPAPAPGPDPAAELEPQRPAHPSSKKKKRKRR